ncbi:Arylsulfotransferase [Cladophialophora carrionii]|uniref:Arylsulfotransferase n=1 Tax=Cladophialophora carrionii TaxID=86049 RepID=A0A1C1CZS2_9EURO|nr:Arylsulfotransferase [Cladophialophora carrionii]
MKSLSSALLVAALAIPGSWLGGGNGVTGFEFNAYDLGLQGIYPRHRFHSVDFEAPKPKITRWDSRCNDGNLLLTPRGPSVQGKARGPTMLDARGNLIWAGNDEFEQVINLNVQKYKGEDYLTFWTKVKKNKHRHKNKDKGKGKKKDKDHNKEDHGGDEINAYAKHPRISYVMLNSSYEVAHRIYPHGKGYKGDSHEFQITPQGTALITIYHKHKVDCTQLGLGKSCWIQDGLFQEIDIETGDLVFEWRATDHVSMLDVFSSPNRKDGYGTSKKDAFDFFHLNSVDKLESGDYIISARYMHAVVCISGKTGEILWQLGGKHNDFRDLNGATDFAWQHHVRWQGNNTISLFDNHANNVFHKPSSQSKGMIIKLDLENMTASVVQTFVHPDEILNVSQGSVQVIAESGNVLVGFGNSPTYIEYAPDGQVLCSAHFAPHIAFEILDFGLVKSYRVFKRPWVGRPNTVPDVKVKSGRMYVSWNGATEVSSWRLERAGARDAHDDEFVTIQELERDGFETSFGLDKVGGFVRIAALDSARTAMAYSAVVKAPPSSLGFLWSTLIFLFGVAVFASGFAGFILCYRRIPWLPRLPRLARVPKLLNLSGLKSRLSQGKIPRWEHEPETEPLLLDERVP